MIRRREIACVVAAVLAVTAGGCAGWDCDIWIDSSLLPEGVVGERYEATFTAWGGCLSTEVRPVPDTDWGIVSGNLPPGIHLLNQGRGYGHIEGTPTAAGLFVFEVEAQGWDNVAREEMSIRIHPEP